MKEMLNFADTGGLFDHFEVNREPFWPRIVRLLVGSGVVHLVLLAVIVFVPPVRDALSLAVIFSGAGFVDRPYKHSEIGDDVDIIDFTTEKFHYPEGYFLMDQQAMPPEYPVMPPIMPSTISSASQPAASPSPSVTPTPSTSASPAIASNKGDAKPSPTVSPDQKSADQAQKELEAASKKTGIELPDEGEINKAPFKDLAAYATQLKDQNKLDFDKPFEIAIETTLDKDGKLVNPRVARKNGDETLVDLGKRLVEAMNDSGVLFYLKKINEDKPGTKVIFTIKQDGKDVVATVESEVASPDSANKLSRGFAMMLLAGAASRKGHDEEVLMKSTKVTAENSKIVFKLTMAHQDVVDIVKKGMEKPAPSVTPLSSKSK